MTGGATFSKKLRTELALWTVFAVVGIGLVVAAILSALDTRAFLEQSIFSTGEIVDVVESVQRDEDGDREIRYNAVIEFETANGETHVFQSRDGARSRPTVGETVDIRFLADDPSEVREDSFNSTWAFPTIFGLIGVLFSVSGAYGSAAAWRKRSDDRQDDLGRLRETDRSADYPQDEVR